MPIKTNTKKSNNSNKSNNAKSFGLKSRPTINKKIGILLVVIVAAVGAWQIFFAAAAPWNCQKDGTIDVCDIDQTAGASDTILSVDGEALTLSNNGWGTYYGPPFRAPTGPLKGAVPVYRIANEKYSWHEFVTEAQKKEKEAKYDGNKVNEGVVFYAWTSQAPGTVPVYRLTRGGSGSQSIFNTDKAWIDRMIAENANNPDGWKSGTTMPSIAFYAYPPNYRVANQDNPYDCSIEVNFLSDRCTPQRENLLKPPVQQTPPRPTSNVGGSNGGSTSGPSSNVGGSNGGVTSTAPSLQAPTSSAPQYVTCPNTLEGYMDGVNRVRANYNKDCHTWWWTTAQNQNKAKELEAFYKQIDDCNKQNGYYYNFECNPYSQEQVAFFQAIEALKVGCLSRGGSWDTFKTTCVEATPAFFGQKGNYTCKLTGIKRDYLSEPQKVTMRTNVDYIKRPITLYPAPALAQSERQAIDGPCAEFRSALNRQDQYQDFVVRGAILTRNFTGSF